MVLCEPFVATGDVRNSKSHLRMHSAPRLFPRNVHAGDFSANEALGVVPGKHIQVAEDRSHFTSDIKPLYRLTVRIDDLV
jgi:hypothetical protein